MSEPSQPTPPGAPEAPEPPAPPAPPVPPVPQYGEYAPGYVPPAPAPQYAQYAPAYGQPDGSASYPQQPAGQRRRKMWDVVLSVILLVLGFIGAFLGVAYGALFSDPALLDEAFQQQGLGGFNGTAGAAPAVLIVSHVLLYLLALGGTIPLLLTKRVAFWVPLTAGIIAAIIFWGALLTVMLSDPGLTSQLQ